MSKPGLNKEAIRILVVDDEESLCEILQFNLEVEGSGLMWPIVPNRR